MRFLVLADLVLLIFCVICMFKSATTAGPWDVMSPFIFITLTWQFQYWAIITSCLLFYMAFDFVRMQKCYAPVFKGIIRLIRRDKTVKEVEMQSKEDTLQDQTQL